MKGIEIGTKKAPEEQLQTARREFRWGVRSFREVCLNLKKRKTVNRCNSVSALMTGYLSASFKVVSETTLNHCFSLF